MIAMSTALLAILLPAIDGPPLLSCNEERTIGRFRLQTLLQNNGSNYVGLTYLIPPHHITPRYAGSPGDGPRIAIEYLLPFDPRGYQHLSFSNFDRLFPTPRFTVRAMSMHCGRDIALAGNTAVQPFPLNGIFARESLLRTGDYIAALRRSGGYEIRHDEVEGPARSVVIRGRADFAGAMREMEAMARRGLARAEAGQCRLNPPIPPPS